MAFSTYTDYFHYDLVGRLKYSKRYDPIALETRTNQFDFDPFGNLIQESEEVTEAGRSPSSPTIYPFPADPATNRLTIELYDYHGQQLSLFAGEQNTVFPRWNQDLEEIVLIEEGSFGQAVYDSNSERVKEDSRYFLRDLDGKVLSEFEGSQWSFQWKRDYIYRGSQMVAAQDSSDGLLHFHIDHLGSPRMVSTASGYVSAKHNYGPFGFEISSPYQNDITKKYTSHERDNLNAPATKYDLDYMHARYYSPWQHRFLSVDPIGGDPRQPQSWNAFSYVLNNPINLVDPYGLVEMLASTGWQSEGQVCNGGIFGGPWCAAFANADSNLLNSTLSEQNGTFFALFDAYKNGTGLDLYKAGTFGLSLDQISSQGKEESDLSAISETWQAVEHVFAPYIAGSAMIGSGAITTYAGVVTTQATLVAAPETYGLSLLATPAGLAVTAGGLWVSGIGVNIHIRQTNNLFGTEFRTIPIPGDPGWPYPHH